MSAPLAMLIENDALKINSVLLPRHFPHFWSISGHFTELLKMNYLLRKFFFIFCLQCFDAVG